MPAIKPSTLPRFGTLEAWQALTFYGIGERVTNSGNVYVCVYAQGESGNAGGPTGNGSAIVDGDLKWDYVSAVAVAWAPTTVYDAGAIVTNDGGNVYSCRTGGTSAGSGGPTGTGAGINDNGVIWDFAWSATAEIVEPTERTKDRGAITGAPLRAGYFNWVLDTIYQWLLYLRDLGLNMMVWRAGQQIAQELQGNAGINYTDGINPDNTSAGFTRIFLWREFLATGIYVNHYYSIANGHEEVVNAEWDYHSSKWHQLDGTLHSIRRRFGGDSSYYYEEKQNGTADFTDGSWNSVAQHNMLNGNFSTSGTVQALAAQIGANGVVVAGNGVEVQAGNIKADAGNVEAAGDPATNKGRLKGLQFVSTAAAPTVTDINNSGHSIAADSTSNAGAITLSSVGGTGPGQLARVVYAKDHPTSSFPVITPTDAVSAAAGLNVRNWDKSGFDVYGTIPAAGAIGFTFVVIGV